MNITFYILIFITANCWSGISLTMDNTNWMGPGVCQEKSKAEIQIVDSLDPLIERKNQEIGSSFTTIGGWPDIIYRVTCQDGKCEKREVKIYPVTRTIRELVERQHEIIERYEVR